MTDGPWIAGDQFYNRARKYGEAPHRTSSFQPRESPPSLAMRAVVIAAGVAIFLMATGRIAL